jgi:RimJ/RimL family protein N-acetyltransferase
MTLQGERVHLRAVAPSDAERLWRWHNDPQVMRWMHAPYPTSLDEVEKELAQRPANSHASLTLMIENASARTVGIIALRGAEPESGSAELDIYLGEKDCWGQGLATDAMRTLCRFGFERMNLHRVELCVADGNDAARHLYEKLGFVTEGRKREVYFREGAWCDEWLMSLLRGELR